MGGKKKRKQSSKGLLESQQDIKLCKAQDALLESQQDIKLCKAQDAGKKGLREKEIVSQAEPDIIVKIENISSSRHFSGPYIRMNIIQEVSAVPSFDVTDSQAF